MSDFITGNSYIFPILIGVLVLLIACFSACFCRSRRMRYLRKSADHHAFNHTTKRLEDLNSFTTRCLDEAFSKAFPPVDEKDPVMRLILLEMLREALGGTGIEVKESGASSRTVSGAALPVTTPPRSPQRGSSSGAKRSPSKGQDDAAGNNGDSTPLRFVFKTTKVEAVAEEAATGSAEASSSTRRKIVAFEITELPTSAEIVTRLLSSTILLAHCRRGGIAAYSALGRYVQRSGSKVFDDIALPKASEDNDNEKSKARRRKDELEASTPHSMWGCWCCCCLPRSKQREYFHKRRRLYWFGLSSMFCSALNLKESERDMERRLREKRHGAKLQNASRMVGGAISPGSKRNTTHFTPIPPPLEGHSGTEMSPMSSSPTPKRGNAQLGSRYASPPRRVHHHEGVDEDDEEVAALISDKKYNNLFLFMGSALSRKMISVCPVVRDRISVAKHPNAPRSSATMGDGGATTNDHSEQLEPSEFSIKISDHPDLMSEFNTKRYIRAIFQPTMPATEEIAISEAYNTRVSRQSQSTSLMSASSTGIPVSAHLVVEGGISRTSSLSRPSPSSLMVANESSPHQQSAFAAASASSGSSGSRATSPPSVTTEHALVEQLHDMYPKGLPIVSDELDASHFSCDTVRDDLYIFFQNLQTTLYHGDMLGNARDYYPMYDAIPAFDEAVKKWYLQVCMLAATTCARSFAAMVASQSKKLCEKEIRSVVDRLGSTQSTYNNSPQRRLNMSSPQGTGVVAAAPSSPDYSRPSSPLSSSSIVSHHIAAAKKWSLHRVPSADTVRGEVVDLIKSRLQQQIALFRDCHLVSRYALMRYEGGPIIDQLLKKCMPTLREADHFDESLITPAMLLFPSHAPVLALHSEQPLPLPRQLTQPQDVPTTIDDAVWYFGQGVDRLPVELAADEICMKDARRSIKRLRGELLDLVFGSSRLTPSSSHINRSGGSSEGFSPREAASSAPPPDDGPVPPPRLGMSQIAPSRHDNSSVDHAPHLGTSGLSLSEQVVTVTFRNLVKGIEEHLKVWVALSEERVAGSLIYHLDPDGKEILAGWQAEVDGMSSSLVRHVAARYHLIRTTVSLSLRVVQLSLKQIYQFLANLHDQPKHSKKEVSGKRQDAAASSAPTTRHTLPLRLPLPPKYVAAQCGDLIKEVKHLRRVVLELVDSSRADANVAESVKSPASGDEPSAFSQNANRRDDGDAPDPYAIRSLQPHLKPSLYFHPTDVLMIVEAAFNVIGSTNISLEEGDAPDAFEPLPPNLFEGL